jgi:hypothetical protein
LVAERLIFALARPAAGSLLMRITLESQKDVKDTARRASERLAQDGITVQFPTMLEAFAAGFQFRNWSTLCGHLPKDTAVGKANDRLTARPDELLSEPAIGAPEGYVPRADYDTS